MATRNKPAANTDGEADDEFGAAPAGDTSPTAPGAEDAPKSAAGDADAAADAKALKEAQEAAEKAEGERDEAKARVRTLLERIGEAAGVTEVDGKPISELNDDEVAEVIEGIEAGMASGSPAQPEVKAATATAVRLTVEEIDGAGKALRRWGLTAPLAQANPAAVADSVRRTVEEIVAVPVGPVASFEQEPVEG